MAAGNRKQLWAPILWGILLAGGACGLWSISRFRDWIASPADTPELNRTRSIARSGPQLEFSGREDEAEAAYRTVLTQNPGSLQARFELAEFLDRQARDEEAREILRPAALTLMERGKFLDSRQKERLAQYADICWTTGRPEEARAAYYKLLESYSLERTPLADMTIRQVRARAYVAISGPTQGFVTYESAVTPKSRSQERRERLLQFALNADPKCALALIALANLLMESGRNVEAKRLLLDAQNLVTPEEPLVLARLGDTYGWLGYTQTARSLNQQALAHASAAERARISASSGTWGAK